jgi:hypothetical protein
MHEMPDEITAGLETALGQKEKTVTIHPDPDDESKTLDVVIRKLRAKQFVKIFACINDLVQKGVVRLTDETGNLILGAKGVLSEFRDEKMLLLGGDPVLEILAIATGLTKQQVDNLDLLDLGKLIGGAWEINERFFVHHQTELKAALGPLWKLVEGVTKKKSSPAASTPDSSTSSSPTDTEASTK